MSEQEINEGVFLTRKPSKFMQNVVSTCQSKKNIILGHYLTKKEIEDKHIWLNTHFPNILERFFVPTSVSKADIILKYCEQNNINLKDVIFVDDTAAIIKEAEKKGISSWLISSFLDWNMT